MNGYRNLVNESKWINPSDSLPDYRTSVIMKSDKGILFIGRRIKNRFMNDEYRDSYNNHANKPLCWCPIPKELLDGK